MRLGWQGTCRYHPPEISNRGAGTNPLPCSREYALKVSGQMTEELALETTRRTLKHWCLRCTDTCNPDRTHHMNASLNSRRPGVLQRNDQELDQELDVLIRMAAPDDEEDAS